MVECNLMVKKQTDKYCILYLVRHGETVWNVEHKFQGQGDSPLTEKGIQQAKQAAEKLKHVKFTAVYSSDLVRAKRTAEIITLEKDIAIQTSQALRERAFGRFEGTLTTEFFKNFGIKMRELTRATKDQLQENHIDPTIESDESLMTRFITFLREISLVHLGKRVLMVTHGGTMRVLLTRLGYLSSQDNQDVSINNTAIIQIWCDGADFIIKEVDGVTKK